MTQISVAIAFVVVSTGCAAGSGPAAEDASRSRQPGSVSVNGIRVPAGAGDTVAAVLRRAHLPVRDGRFRSVRRRRLLTPDGEPAEVLVNGQPASLASTTNAGDIVVANSGTDRIEPVRSVTVAVPAAPPSPLYVAARPGVARVTEGVLSGEQVRRVVVRAPTRGRLIAPGAVALSFDDGPDPVWTPRILSLLRARRVPATFCLIGRAAAQHPALVRRIAARHRLCNQTWSHDLNLDARDAATIGSQLDRADAAIMAAGVAPPRFYRAPGGEWSAQLDAAARARGMAPLRWTVDTRDWARPGVGVMWRTVLDELRPGGVILLHDGGGDRAQTLALLRMLLDRLPKMGYRFVLPPLSAFAR